MSRHGRLAVLEAIAWLVVVPLISAALLEPILGFDDWSDRLLPGGEDGSLRLAEPPASVPVARVSAPVARGAGTGRADERPARARPIQRRRTLSRAGDPEPRRGAVPAPGVPGLRPPTSDSGDRQAPGRQPSPARVAQSEASPPVVAPAPVDLPPVDAPRVDLPPVDVPAVDVPPVELTPLPPLDVPPVDLPSLDAPPVNLLPVAR